MDGRALEPEALDIDGQDALDADGDSTSTAPEAGGSLHLSVAAGVAFLCATLAITAFAFAQWSFAIPLSFLVFGGSGLVLAARVGFRSAKLFLLIYSCAAIAAILLFYYQISAYGVPYFMGGSDEVDFEAWGLTFAERFGVFDYSAIRGLIVHEAHNSVGYIYLVGLLQKLGALWGGFHTMMPRLFNAMCLGLVAVVVYQLGQKVSVEPRHAAAAALFAGLLPLMMFSAVQTVRELPVALMLVWVAYVWTPDASGAHRRSKMLAALWTVVCFVALYELRQGQAYVAALIGLLGLAMRGTSRRRFMMIFWVGLAVAVAGVLYIGFSQTIFAAVGNFVSQGDKYATYRVEGTGGGLSTIIFTTPPPLGYVLRAAYLLASPLPVFSIDLDIDWLSVGTIIHLFYLPFLFVGVRESFARAGGLITLAAFLMLFASVALLTFSGRHIVQYLPFAIVLAAMGYERHERWRTLYFRLMGLSMGMLAITYLYLKTRA